VRYAIEYKYIKGSLLEHALKKERILLEVNKSLKKQLLIDLIAVGLPSYICDRINRNSLEETEDFFNEIRGLEHLVKKTFDKKKMYLEKKSKIVEIKNVTKKNEQKPKIHNLKKISEKLK